MKIAASCAAGGTLINRTAATTASVASTAATAATAAAARRMEFFVHLTRFVS